MQLSRVNEFRYLVLLSILLLKGLHLAETVGYYLFGREEHCGALVTFELLDTRFLHCFAQMLNHILGVCLVTLEEIRPGVLAANPTVIN